jgi:hypothetical protein
MRKLIFAINTTLDGCDHTKQIADEETHKYFISRTSCKTLTCSFLDAKPTS